jgi:hypothetical protein
MTDTPRSRWAGPVAVSGVFTEEQAQRVQALRCAREVLEDRHGGGPFTATSSTTANAPVSLVLVASWIMDLTPEVPTLRTVPE